MNYAHVAGLYDIAVQTDFDLPFHNATGRDICHGLC